ncbi:hypothetical protein D047_1962B, partial [Vibrio parahaemolyticus VPTS-2010_2]
LARRSERRPLL